ncbi:MAG: glycosyltransferase [Erysipelotrichales bacterium]|nr:glycosyltransferase [Erysipelotrichales bacterium]
MRVCMAAGGTGGHIYPAMALAKEICKDLDSEVLFVGTTTRMEAKILPEAGYPYLGIEVTGVANQSLLGKIAPLFQILKAKNVVRKKLKEFKPDIVVGFGNYISVPVILAAPSAVSTSLP